MENNLDIYKALAKAQIQFGPAIKDADNPFFKSKYADIAACWDACKEALAANNLFMVQPTKFLPEASVWVVNTRIYHESGGFIEGFYPIIPTKQNDPQSFGSATTYARRYGFAAVLGIVTEDDDAEGAMSREDKSASKMAATKQESKPQATQIEERATPKQKHDIEELSRNPVFTREERSKVQLAINTYSKEKAEVVKKQLESTIVKREREVQNA